MGTVFSTKFKEAMDADCRDMATPAKRIHRILDSDFDPRSPTIGVNRTPIAISVSPCEDGSTEMTSKNIVQTPQPDPLRKLDVDPRSPTEGIVRTPIHYNGPFLQSIQDPRSPCVVIQRTPIVAEVEDRNRDELEHLPLLHSGKSDSVPDIDAIPPIAVLDLEVMNRSLSEPDLSKDEIKLLGDRNRPSSASFRESTPKKKSDRKVIYQGLSHDDLTTRSIQVKEMSPLRLRSSQRSPLSLRTNFDVNSPRNIVQRKQVNKLNLSIKGSNTTKKCGTESPSRFQTIDSTNKENMI